MTRVLVAWEDEHFRGLERVVRRRITARAERGGVTPPVVLHHTARGNGVFRHYVGSTWTRARAAGLPNSPGPIDHLVCVIDGDKLCERHPEVARPPTRPETVAAWHAQASATWQSLLRAWVDPSVPPTSVHGMVLRWSRESVILAGFDLPPFQAHLGFDAALPPVQTFLKDECAPSPGSFAGGLFTDAFQRPLKCLERLFRVPRLALPSKSDPVFDDVLLSLAGDHLDRVCERVPDLDALVERTMDPAAEPNAASASRVAPPRRGKGRKSSK